MPEPAIGIRWTVGDVAPRGFEALALSIHGAAAIFGDSAEYAVCVNTIDPAEARRRCGHVPAEVSWRRAGLLQPFIAEAAGEAMAEGVAWKLAPLRLFPDRYELSLDNDCILWSMPGAIRTWLRDPERRCLIAADVTPAHGAFAGLTRPEPRNTGIRGFPPGYDLGAALARVLAMHPRPLRSELDEQGLQVVALDLGRRALIVPNDDVTICSPFPPHQNRLGRCGAHFVGLNASNLPWRSEGRPASALIAEHFDRLKPQLEAMVAGARADA